MGGQAESKMAFDHYKLLKRMYELLSHGTSFYDFSTIQRFQLCQHATNWINGNPEEEINIDINSIVHGNINEWTDRLIISVEFSNIDEDIKILKSVRLNAQNMMEKLFKNWQKVKDFNFEKQYELELSSYGDSIMNSYFNYLRNYLEIRLGISNDVDKLINTDTPIIIHSILDEFKKAGLNEEGAFAKVGEFFRSPSLGNVPFLKICTLLYPTFRKTKFYSSYLDHA